AGAALGSGFAADGGGGRDSPERAAGFASGSSADFGTKVFFPLGPSCVGGGSGGADAAAVTAATAVFCLAFASFSFACCSASAAFFVALLARHAWKFATIFSSSAP